MSCSALLNPPSESGMYMTAPRPLVEQIVPQSIRTSLQLVRDTKNPTVTLRSLQSSLAETWRCTSPQTLKRCLKHKTTLPMSQKIPHLQ